METYLWVVFGGVFFVALTWGSYRVGYIRGWNAYNREVTVGKKKGDKKKW